MTGFDSQDVAEVRQIIDEHGGSGGGGGGGDFSVSDDGTLVVENPGGLSFGANVDVTDNGDGTVTIDVSDMTESELTALLDDNYSAAGHDHSGETINPAATNTEQETINNVRYVGPGTPADLDAACSQYSVVVATGGTYSGATTITVPGETKLFLYGATIDYTGSSEAILLDGSAGQNPRPLPCVFGGTISGNPDADAGILVRDSYGTTTRDVEIESFTGQGSGRGAGWAVENVEGWSEYNTLTDFSIADCLRCIEFRGAGATGGSGTSSMKATHVRDGHLEVHDGGDGIHVNAGVYDSQIDTIGVNIGSDANIINFQMASGGTTFQNIRGETQGSTNTYVVNFGSGVGGGAPTLMGVTCAGTAGYVRNNPDNTTFGQWDITGALSFKNHADGTEQLKLSLGAFSTFQLKGANLRFRNEAGNQFVVKDNGGTKAPQGIEIPKDDLSTVPVQPDTLRSHNGADGNPQGVYFGASNGSEWKYLADGGSTTIMP